MREGLMTAEELDERFDKEDDLDLAIEKYERAKNPCNWDMVLASKRYFGADACPLCKRHTFPCSCAECPLPTCTGNDDSLYSRVLRAARNGNRAEFIEACDAMLAKLREIKEEQEFMDVELKHVRYVNVYEHKPGELTIGGTWETAQDAVECAFHDAVATGVEIKYTVNFKMKRR
jgi:hypothetical protein